MAVWLAVEGGREVVAELPFGRKDSRAAAGSARRSMCNRWGLAGGIGDLGILRWLHAMRGREHSVWEGLSYGTLGSWMSHPRATRLPALPPWAQFGHTQPKALQLPFTRSHQNRHHFNVLQTPPAAIALVFLSRRSQVRILSGVLKLLRFLPRVPDTSP